VQQVMAATRVQVFSAPSCTYLAHHELESVKLLSLKIRT